MLTSGWDWDRAKAVWQREAYEEGEWKGERKTRQEDVINLRRYGLSPTEIAKALKIPETTVTHYLKQFENQ